MSIRTIAALLTVAISLGSSPAAAQAEFPSKPLRLLVGFPPGGSTDVLARALSLEGRKLLAQEVVVVNRPGASGVIAITEVAAAPADGYTLGLTPSTALTLAHHFMNIRPDLLESTTALMLVARQRIGMVTQGSGPQRTLKELLEHARKNPGKVSVGIPGLGTKVEIITRAIASYEKVDLNVVPFQGDAGVMSNLLGGHVTAGSLSAGGWANQVRAGTMRLLASFEDERFEVASDVPTLREMGYPLTGAAIQHLYGPKAMPAALVKRLVTAFSEVTRSPAYIEVATQNALYEKTPLAGEALEEVLRKDRAANTALVDKLGLKKKP
ncbi:MAG: tripartite tricarboxylate transporter substrate binding protein [Burkholderiales bacterium]|nr:tripartite tricarboxylate transporter substrate binding protein [Burkholderiales bacterium]